MTIDAGQSCIEVNIILVEPSLFTCASHISNGVTAQARLISGISKKVQFDLAAGVEASGVQLARSVDQPCSDEGCEGGIAPVDLFDTSGKVVAVTQMTHQAIGVGPGARIVSPEPLRPLLVIETDGIRLEDPRPVPAMDRQVSCTAWIGKDPRFSRSSIGTVPTVETAACCLDIVAR